MGHGLGTTLRGVGVTVRGDQLSAKKRAYGASRAGGNDKEGCSAYSSGIGEDGRSWEDNYKDDRGRLGKLECLSGSIPVYGAKIRG